MENSHEKEPFSSRRSFCFPVPSVNFQLCVIHRGANPGLRVLGTSWGPLPPRQPTPGGTPHPSGPRAHPSAPCRLPTPLDAEIRSASHNAASWEWIRKQAVWYICYGHDFQGETVTSSSFCRFCNPSQPATDSFMNFYSFGSVQERRRRERSFLMDLSY